MIDPEDTARNQLRVHEEYAEKMLNDIIAGRVRINATRRNTYTYPTVEEV